MPSLTIPPCDGVPEQPHHSSAYCDFDEFQSLQRRRTAEVNDGDVVESRQVCLEPKATPAIPCDTEERQESQATMLDPSIVVNDALINVVRNILQLQKRQVELYEEQVGILGRYARVKPVANITEPSSEISWDGEVDSESHAGSKGCGAAAPNVNSKAVCKRIAEMQMDVASPPPDFEPTMEFTNPHPCQNSKGVIDCVELSGMRPTQWLGFVPVDSTALLKPEFYVNLPTDMTAPTRNTLIFLGAVPAAVFEQGFVRALYRLYRCFIIASLLFCGITWLAGGLLQVWAGLYPAEWVYFISFGAIGPATLLTVWQQFRCGGAYLDMLHQLSRRRFDWKLFNESVYVCWCMVLMLEAAVALCVCALHSRGELTQVLPTNAEYSSSIRHFEGIFRIWFKLSIPSNMFCLAIGIPTIWCCRMFSDIHRYEVLDYGTVFASVMEEGDGSHDIVLMLKRLEHSVTARLRYASSTWVRTGMFAVCVHIFMSLVIGTWMFSSPNVRGTIFASVFLLWVCVSSGVATVSMARVAETFDHDVFRVLNNPHVLREAHRYFGEQLIEHLHGLSWGFRFGGTIINTQFCSRLLVGLSSTVTITISQACYALIGSSP